MGVFNFGRLGFGAGSLGCGLVLLGGCGGPTLADLAQGEVSLTVMAVASDPEVAASGESQGGLGVSRAFLSASSVTLLPCLADASTLDLGPHGYELVGGGLTAERVTTAVSELCGLRIDVDPVDAVTAEGVEPGKTLYVEARDADGNAVTLSSESSLSMRFEAASGTSFGDLPILLGFDLTTWLAGLPLAEDMSEESAALLASQLLDSAALYVDSNGNDLLDADEMTPVARASSSR